MRGLFKAARLLCATLLSSLLFPVFPAAASAFRATTPLQVGGETDSQINESAADDTTLPEGPRRPPPDLPGRLRVFVEDSLGKYDQVKNEAAGFRKQGWFPSFFLRDPDRDLVLETEPGGTKSLNVYLSYARRDIEQRLIIAPVERFELPSADRRFLAELITALVTAAPEIGRVRLLFWFAVLEANGRMTWEYRGSLALAAAAARGLPPGPRTPQAVWPVLEENTLPGALWPEP